MLLKFAVDHFVNFTLYRTLSNGAKDTQQESNLVKKPGFKVDLVKIGHNCRVNNVLSQQSGTLPLSCSLNVSCFV